MEDISLPLTGEMCGSFVVTFSKSEIYQNSEKEYPFFILQMKYLTIFIFFHSSSQVKGVNETFQFTHFCRGSYTPAMLNQHSSQQQCHNLRAETCSHKHSMRRLDKSCCHNCAKGGRTNFQPQTRGSFNS